MALLTGTAPVQGNEHVGSGVESAAAGVLMTMGNGNQGASVESRGKQMPPLDTIMEVDEENGEQWDEENGEQWDDEVLQSSDDQPVGSGDYTDPDRIKHLLAAAKAKAGVPTQPTGSTVNVPVQGGNTTVASQPAGSASVASLPRGKSMEYLEATRKRAAEEAANKKRKAQLKKEAKAAKKFFAVPLDHLSRSERGVAVTDNSDYVLVRHSFNDDNEMTIVMYGVPYEYAHNPEHAHCKWKFTQVWMSINSAVRALDRRAMLAMELKSTELLVTLDSGEFQCFSSVYQENECVWLCDFAGSEPGGTLEAPIEHILDATGCISSVKTMPIGFGARGLQKHLKDLTNCISKRNDKDHRDGKEKRDFKYGFDPVPYQTIMRDVVSGLAVELNQCKNITKEMRDTVNLDLVCALYGGDSYENKVVRNRIGLAFFLYAHYTDVSPWDSDEANHVSNYFTALFDAAFVRNMTQERAVALYNRCNGVNQKFSPLREIVKHATDPSDRLREFLTADDHELFDELECKEYSEIADRLLFSMYATSGIPLREIREKLNALHDVNEAYVDAARTTRKHARAILAYKDSKTDPELKKKYRKAKSQIRVLKDDLHDANVRIKDLEEELADAEHELRNNEREITKLKADLAAITKERDELKASLATVTAELAEAKTHIAQLTKDKLDYEEEIDRLNARIEDHMDIINNPIATLAHKSDAADALEAASDNLEAIGPMYETTVSDLGAAQVDEAEKAAHEAALRERLKASADKVSAFKQHLTRSKAKEAETARTVETRKASLAAQKKIRDAIHLTPDQSPGRNAPVAPRAIIA
jgi:hypothetical protein